MTILVFDVPMPVKVARRVMLPDERVDALHGERLGSLVPARALCCKVRWVSRGVVGDKYMDRTSCRKLLLEFGLRDGLFGPPGLPLMRPARSMEGAPPKNKKRVPSSSSWTDPRGW